MGIVSGWPCAVIVLIITGPLFPLARARAPCNAGFFPPAAQLPLLARARERESGLAEISEPRFLEKKSLLVPERDMPVVKLTVGGVSWKS